MSAEPGAVSENIFARGRMIAGVGMRTVIGHSGARVPRRSLRLLRRLSAIFSFMFLSATLAFPTRSTGQNRRIYSLDRPFWRQGFATEAAGASRDWLFEHFPLPRAASFIRPDNQVSKRVAERLGAVYERTFEWRGSSHEHWTHCRTDPRS